MAARKFKHAVVEIGSDAAVVRRRRVDEDVE
jgi:hypothetical protein